MHPLTRGLTCHKEGTFWYSNIWEDELADHSGTLLVQPCRAGVKIPTWKSSQAEDWKVSKSQRCQAFPSSLFTLFLQGQLRSHKHLLWPWDLPAPHITHSHEGLSALGGVMQKTWDHFFEAWTSCRLSSSHPAIRGHPCKWLLNTQRNISIHLWPQGLKCL